MRHTYYMVLLATLCGCAAETESTRPSAAAAELRPTLQYRIDALPTAGPGTSQGAAINNADLIAGYTGTADGRRAALWQGGAITPLGTLPGGAHSMVQWPGLNSNGMIVGISRTGDPAPLGESWSCSAFLPGAGKICLGFVWENGVMSPLPTLGGPNGFAAGVNARGQVVGWAENLVQDATCNTPQVYQFRAVLWEPRNGSKIELTPLGDDHTSAATAINERSQVVGISGECDVAVGRKSATHAVLWDHGKPQDLGSLGGDFWHTPMAINDRGEIVGFSNPPGGDFDGDDLRAFHWTRATGMKDLGKLESDTQSQALGINAKGQIVGVSCGEVCTAILWQDDQLYILKDLVPGFTGHLWSARSINDAGQITGRMYDANGTPMGYLATPIAAPSAAAPR